MEEVGLFNGHLVCFTDIWYIYGHLVYLSVIRYVFPVLVNITEKNLATTVNNYLCQVDFKRSWVEVKFKANKV
jgi:hypothetical protein